MPNGRGRGLGRGLGIRRPADRRRIADTKLCTCPKCGYTELCTRGVPCTERQCPKCGTYMKGTNCK